MFAHWIWSLLLIAAPIALYWSVIRPRLKARFTDLYDRIDSLPSRLWAYTYAFRTFWIAAFGVVITAAPDLLVIISPLDFSPWLPQPWPAYTGPATTAAITVMKAFETKPKGEAA